MVGPFPTDKTREDVAEGAGYVGETDDDDGETVGRVGEGGFHADVKEVERSECNTGIEDCEQDSRKPKI